MSVRATFGGIGRVGELSLGHRYKSRTNIRESTENCQVFSVDSYKSLTHVTRHERLERWAKAKFGSQTNCAKASGLSTSQLNDYTTGRSNPGPDIVARWAKLGLNTNWWLTGDGDMDAPGARKALYISDGEIALTEDDIHDAIARKRAAAQRTEEVLIVTVRKGVPPVTSGDFAPLVPAEKKQKA